MNHLTLYNTNIVFNIVKVLTGGALKEPRLAESSTKLNRLLKESRAFYTKRLRGGTSLTNGVRGEGMSGRQVTKGAKGSIREG